MNSIIAGISISFGIALFFILNGLALASANLMYLIPALIIDVTIVGLFIGLNDIDRETERE